MSDHGCLKPLLLLYPQGMKDRFGESAQASLFFRRCLTDAKNSTIVQQLAGAANYNILLGGNTI
jgi:hypothetical protein